MFESTISRMICILIQAYLLGSLPAALWISQRFGGIDIRESGSGNPGATNVLRTLGWKTALPVFLIDAGKGVAAVWISMFLMDSGMGPASAAVMAVIGHQYSVFSRFKGGRGVSTSVGCLLLLDWRVLIIGLLVFAVVAGWSRIVSLGSLVAAGTACCSSFGFLVTDGNAYRWTFAAILVIVLLLIVGHRDNIRRLKRGRERPIEV